MYYVYVIKSEKYEWIYVGMTKDLKKRLDAHNLGRVTSTKSKRPFRIVYKINAKDSIEARRKEKYFKTKAGKEWLKRRHLL